MTPPEEFICPLTKEIMSEPMVTRYGVRFERKAIMEWLEQGNNYCPITRNPLRVSNLISDKNFQWKIQFWASKHGYEDKLTLTNDEVEKVVVATAAIPDDRFICPLTKDIMKEPMMSRHGTNYEKSAILARLDKNGCVCPVTGKSLMPSDLVSNHKLQWEIKQWQLQYGEAYDEETQLEMDFKLAKATMVSKGYETVDIIKALANGREESDTDTASDSDGSDPNILSCLDDVIGTIE